MGIQTVFSSTPVHRLSRYGLALLALLVSLVVSAILNQHFGNETTYVLMFPAVIFSAWYCGSGPAVLAIALGTVAGLYGPSLSIHPFAMPEKSDWVSALVFVLSSALAVVMGESRRRQNERLRRAQGELEEKVRERTADLDAVNGSLRELSARLLQLQDEERRRIARELHDSVGQTLAALSMNLSAVRGEIERVARAAATLNDSEGLVRGMVTEVRTISHLLHPPLLDEAGLSSALRWYVDGFSQRSGIKVDIDIPEGLERLPADFETAIFRVVQECLTNIHRHSGSLLAKIRIRERDGQVMVDIEDKGRGISQEKLAEMATGTTGVGIRGMQERLRQLGGKLSVESDNSGTIVIVRLPLPDGGEKKTEVPKEPSPAAA